MQRQGTVDMLADCRRLISDYLNVFRSVEIETSKSY